MKRRSLKVGVFISYFLLMAWVLEFKITLIVNLPQFGAVLLGTLLLSVVDVRKKSEGKTKYDRVKWYLMITGYFVTFLSELVYISQNSQSPTLYLGIVSNFLPIFYALLLYLAMEVFVVKESVTIETPEALPEPMSQEAFFEQLALTKREKAIAQGMLDELSNKEIGDQLFISESTVKKHVQSILKKAQVKNRTEFENKIRHK